MPPKRQPPAKYLYEFVRNDITHDILHRDYRYFLPYLLGSFSSLLINNWLDETFVFMLPTFSNAGFVYSLALLSWCVYVGAGFRRFGIEFLGKALIPEGVLWYLLWLIISLEFFATFVVRPVILTPYLLANMFAGHLVVLVLMVGGSLLLTLQNSLMYDVSGAVSVVFSLAILLLEPPVGVSQAYIFTVLTTQYASASVSEAH